MKASPILPLAVVTAFVFTMFASLFMLVAIAGARGRPTGWFLRWVNRADRMKDGSVMPQRLSLVPIRWASGYGITAGILSGSLIFPAILDSRAPAMAAVLTALTFTTVGGWLILLTAYLHYRVSASRKWKYEVFTAGVLSLYIAGSLLAVMFGSEAAEWKQLPPLEVRTEYAYELGGRLGAPMVWAALVSTLFALTIRPRRSSPINALPPLRVRALYWIRPAFNPAAWLGTISVINAIMRAESAVPWLFFLALILPCRYLLVERMKGAPIVYLRSFHSDESAIVLGKIVLPAARRFAPVVTVSHPLQPASRILNRGDPEMLNLSRLPDSEWHTWMTQRLRTASAVIVDSTVSSAGLLWELDAARRTLPPERIVIMVVDGSLVVPPGAEPVIYRLGRRAERKARKELKQRLRIAFASFTARPAARAAWPSLDPKLRIPVV
jgi:hypothetical protein